MVQVSNRWTDNILSAFNGAEELAKVPISTLGLCAVDSLSPWVFCHFLVSTHSSLLSHFLPLLPVSVLDTRDVLFIIHSHTLTVSHNIL